MASSRTAAPEPLRTRVAATLARRLTPGDVLTLGLSGGRDSVVLLDLLAQLAPSHGFTLSCVHVHHGLSPHADDWAAFCAARCAVYGVPLQLERVVLQNDDPRGVEAAARAARQAVFERQPGWIATAHHQNDQAETLLLQLLRGAGPRGLAAMPAVAGRHLRPLLDVPGKLIADYAEAHGLRWVEDESNQDTRFRRNALRQRVLPVLTAHFPHASAVLARAAGLQADAAGLLDELAMLDAAQAITGERLECAALAALSPARARNLLRHFIERQGGRLPQQAQLDEALNQLLHARDDGCVALALGPGTLARYRRAAYWLPPLTGWTGEAALTAATPTLHCGASGVLLRLSASVGSGLSQQRLRAARVRFRRGGERLRLQPDGPHHSLKTLWQARAVPPWRRERWPLIFVGDVLVWAGELGTDAAFACAPDEAGWVLCAHDCVLDPD